MHRPGVLTAQMKQIVTFILLLLLAVQPPAAPAQTGRGWQPDILGDGYEMHRVVHEYTFAGPVVSTIIRKLCPPDPAGKRATRGVLYIHGFNDYFFQAETGNRFVARGYDFYAVDLRRYGRSILPGQRLFDMRDITEYFPDIDSALVAMKDTGIKDVILMGHSTGGLIAACFESRKHPPEIKALILNSPFLDWNIGWKERLIPAVTMLGRILPDMKISQDGSTAYGESLLKSKHGEWEFDTGWKLLRSPDVTAGWVRAISLAQHSLRGGKAGIKIPVLLLYSSHSVAGNEWTPEFQRADAVLDVGDIRKHGMKLGPHVTCVKVMNGLHDLVLSAPTVREPLFSYIFSWLGRNDL